MPLDGGKAYSLYDAVRRMLEPLRRDWEKFTPAEREVIITELEAFLRSVKPDDGVVVDDAAVLVFGDLDEPDPDLAA